ncbi:MAG: methylmalonyl-CoA epimerase [Magnetococcales bacterium]|nr:methylmalonyl-CoA epimerase [Magnetococcales bacterium]HIJ85871.1 methylmalonyl-CoA epimerase [Magnetococcales bacterium]
MIGRLNHVAIVVPDLDAAAARYRDDMGAKVEAAHDIPEHGVRVVMVRLDNTTVELLHPMSDSSPVAGFLKKNPGGGLHHVCYEVQDVVAATKVMMDKGVKVLNEKPKIGAHGNPVVFLHPKDFNGVLTELEQVPSK